MHTLDTALESCHEATNRLIAAGEASGAAWAEAPAPGKWSPSQIVEHVARSLEESANVAAGAPSKFPKLPSILHPVVRTMLFKRVLKKEVFPKAKTNKAMNPMVGPSTPTAGRDRLQAAQLKFDAACRAIDAGDGVLRTPMFGTVSVSDYVRFMALHTRHHEKQIRHGDDRR
jgi:hypothetical protein